MTDRTHPDEDAILGIVLVALMFVIAVMSGFVFLAVATGLVLGLLGLALL